MTTIQENLFSMQDKTYRDFQKKLMPTVNADTIIGVRTPQLRKYAKTIAKTTEAMDFIKVLPHTYYDENNLHAFIIETIKDYDKAVYETDRFLPFIDNWATCDLFVPKVFKKNTDKLLIKIKEWINSNRVYTVRYGIGLLMGLYLNDLFEPEMLALVAAIRSEEYYINMMIAWYFATALTKQYDAALPYITKKKLSTWVHNKAIQKCVESYRIDAQTKEYLKTFKIKHS